MNKHRTFIKTLLAACAAIAAAQAGAQITFYEHENFRGRSFTTQSRIEDFRAIGFNDRASSVVVQGDRWEACDDVYYGGNCIILRPGQYPSLAAMGMNDRLSSVREVHRDARFGDRRYAPAPPPMPPLPPQFAGPPMAPQIVLYEHENFQGRTFATDHRVGDLNRVGFNDIASSAVVIGDRWEVCTDSQFNGRCMVLRPGRYPALGAFGLNDNISSVREVDREARFDDNRYAPPAPLPVYDARRREGEQTFEARVTAVRAVLATPQQRCWVEREQVVQNRNEPNAGGALAGALIGGIIGHQIGDGNGRDVATVAGVFTGAVVGANAGRDTSQQVVTQNVQRCATAPQQARPEYWDVTYEFRGQLHRMQTTYAPGNVVLVNGAGEPRS
jgi:uncharacterized protein YcfJ